MSRSLHAFAQVENRLDRDKRSVVTLEKRERQRTILAETAKSAISALFGGRSEEEQEALFWEFQDQALDRFTPMIGALDLAAGLAARAGRLTSSINPKASSAKTAADRLFSAKEPA